MKTMHVRCSGLGQASSHSGAAHAVHHGRAIRHFGHQYQTFHAQQAVSGMIGQSLQQQS
jgi:hypothetical protein